MHVHAAATRKHNGLTVSEKLIYTCTERPEHLGIIALASHIQVSYAWEKHCKPPTTSRIPNIHQHPARTCKENPKCRTAGHWLTASLIQSTITRSSLLKNSSHSYSADHTETTHNSFVFLLTAGMRDTPGRSMHDIQYEGYETPLNLRSYFSIHFYFCYWYFLLRSLAWPFVRTL